MPEKTAFPKLYLLNVAPADRFRKKRPFPGKERRHRPHTYAHK